MEGGRRHSSTRASRTKHPTSIKQDQLRRTSGADTPCPRPQNRPLDFFLIGCSEPVELIGGVEMREIKVVPPNPTWPAKFAIEREKILTALGVKAVRVDHIGSTSVPLLAAKPIIDIDLSVLDVDREEHYLPDLIAAGYQLRVREPGHRMVRTPDLGCVYTSAPRAAIGNAASCSFVTGCAMTNPPLEISAGHG
jgi:hypothetical protein